MMILHGAIITRLIKAAFCSFLSFLGWFSRFAVTAPSLGHLCSVMLTAMVSPMTFF